MALVIHPGQARAGFFSTIIKSNEAEANTAQTEKDLFSNSQTMTLLQANVLPEPLPTPQKGKEVEQIDENKDISIVSDNALLPATGPVGIADGSLDSSLDPSVYVVRKGDALSAIAKMFGVSENTILWANDMKKGDKLVEGDVLLILPVSGLEHVVKKGQTLKGIANLYKADPLEIAQFNDISLDSSLTVGDKLIIPNATKSEESDKPVKNLKASIAKDNKYYESHPTKTLSGYYINPVPGYIKSQGIHDRNAVDLAISSGTPVHAAASGHVTLAREGYNGGFGNLIIISHANGTETLYAHLSRINTSTGASVSQGQVIGNVGTTGHSTGPHLHFEVHGAKNPGANGSWAH